MNELEKGDLVQRKWAGAKKDIGIVTSVHDDEDEDWLCSVFVKWLHGFGSGHVHSMRYQMNQLKRLKADNEKG